jgi:hypothetical protein
MRPDINLVGSDLDRDLSAAEAGRDVGLTLGRYLYPINRQRPSLAHSKLTNSDRTRPEPTHEIGSHLEKSALVRAAATRRPRSARNALLGGLFIARSQRSVDVQANFDPPAPEELKGCCADGGTFIRPGHEKAAEKIDFVFLTNRLPHG